jgi:LCCL domain
MKVLQKMSWLFALLLSQFMLPAPALSFNGNRLSPPQTTINWGTNATSLRGQNGKRVTYTCPGGGRFGSVWGTDKYTDDSSICTAAVHAGRINAQTGGTVTIEICAGEPKYTGSTRYGVTTASYGAWHGSYNFVGGIIQPPPPDVVTINWDANATSLRGQIGKRVTYLCPAGGRLGRIWGTDIYTDDSSICTAAVHTGRINAQSGGRVTLEMRAGQAQYAGLARYGVTSAGYGAWHGSFVFVGDGVKPPPPPPPPPPGVETITWAASVTALRGQNGKRVSYRCPANGTFGRVWGTDVYTDDSSVCTAAVHAGLLSPQSGGIVTIEIRAGQASYAGTARNGVTTAGYGGWHGSYVFVR